jgi:putative membrane protein
MFVFIIRLLVGAAGLWLAAYLLKPNIGYDSLVDLVIAAAILGIANAILRPILVVLTLPITVITLGLFLLVVNGALIWLVGHFSPGFHVLSLISGIEAAVITGVVSWIGHALTGGARRVQRV